MSYVLHVWQEPAPISLADAVRIHQELSRSTGQQSRRFIEFAKRLTARYPCIADEEGEGDSPDVWTDGPLDGRTPGAVYAIGVNTEHLDTVVPFVVEVASQLGLVLLDEQAGAAYLPDGSALTACGRSKVAFPPPPPRGEELDERQHVVDALNEVISPALAAHGFKSLKRWSDTHAPHKRRFKDCDQYLFFDIEHAGARGYQANVQFHIDPKLPAPVRQVLGFYEKWHGVSLYVDFVAAAVRSGIPLVAGVRPGTGLKLLYTVTEAKAWAREVTEFVERAILPAVDRCDTFAGIDACLNAPSAGEARLLKANGTYFGDLTFSDGCAWLAKTLRRDRNDWQNALAT